MKKILILVIVLSFLISLIGCGKLNIKTDEGTISLNGNKLEIEGKDGEKVSVTGDQNNLQIKTNEGTTNISSDGNTIQVKGNNGENANISIGQAKIPEGYPSDIVPIMDGAQLLNAGRIQDSDKDVFIINSAFEKSYDDIYDFYKKVMANAEDLQEIKMNNSAILIGIKGEYEVNVIVRTEEESKTVLVDISLNKK